MSDIEGKQSDGAEVIQIQMEWLKQTHLPKSTGAVWLSREAGSVLALRNILLEKGLRREEIKKKPYWSTKGHAHRKVLQSKL